MPTHEYSDYLSTSSEDQGFKYNLPKSGGGPKPETQRPVENKKKQRRRKEPGHSRQKEHLAEFEEAERH